jgi:hypothetical protein
MVIGTERPRDSFSGNISGIFGIVSLQCVLGVDVYEDTFLLDD